MRLSCRWRREEPLELVQASPTLPQTEMFQKVFDSIYAALSLSPNSLSSEIHILVGFLWPFFRDTNRKKCVLIWEGIQEDYNEGGLIFVTTSSRGNCTWQGSVFRKQLEILYTF